MNKFTSPSGSYHLSFDYLGLASNGTESVSGDLGGFAGYAYSNIPDEIGNTPGQWLAGTQDNYPAFPGVVDEPLAVYLPDTGRWEHVSIEFSPEENEDIHLVFEDYRLSGGSSGDVYFDNILLEVLEDGSTEEIPEEEIFSYSGRIAKGRITGGNTGGALLSTAVEEHRCFRNISLEEVEPPSAGVPADQIWLIIHGWNSDPKAVNINILVQEIIKSVDENDQVLVLDWSEAAHNKGTGTDEFSSVANGIAATWIAPTAEFVVTALKQQYGIDAQAAGGRLNLVGHSLGSLVGAEIGRVYGTGVRTITALEPPSDFNLPLGGYDIDGRIEGRTAPADFSDFSRFSRAFISS